MKKSLILLTMLTAGALWGVPAQAANDEIVTVSVCGEYWLSPDSDVSPREAFFYAENDAREKAIEKICGERVASWETLLSSSAQREQSYSAVTVTESVGRIHGVKILRQGWRFPAKDEGAFTDLLKIFVEADVAMKKSAERADPAFTALVEGGKSRYKHGEDAVFSVKTSQDAYLTVFWLNSDFQADIVCNNNRISPRKAQELEMTFTIESARAKKEAGTLFFVLTKSPRPFLKSESSKDLPQNRERIEKWLASIPLKERFIAAVPFVIER